MGAMLVAALMIAGSSAGQLRITAYDKTQPSRLRGPGAIRAVRRIFREAGISISWVTGVLTDSEASLMIYEAPRKGREEEGACHARRDIALDIVPSAPPTLHRTVLGIGQPLARTGLNVRVFDDHVLQASESRNMPSDMVLAHAIAHEIGHVLLRSGAHRSRGLMSEVWTSREYEEMAKGSLLFTADESRKMCMTLKGAACPTLD